MSHSLHYNGVDLGDPRYGLTVVEGTVSIAPARRVSVQEIAGGHGGFAHGRWYGARVLKARCWVEADTEPELRAKLDALKAALNTSTDAGIRFDAWCPDRYWLGSLRDGIESGYTRGGVEFDIEFVCADPFGYSTGETVQSVTVDESPESFSVPSSEVMGGSIDALPVWQYTAAGAVSSVIVANSTIVGDSLRWVGSLSAGHLLRIDAARWTVEKSTDAGATWTDARSGISDNLDGSASVFPRLWPGVANACTLTGPTAGSLVVTYRARWI